MNERQLIDEEKPKVTKRLEEFRQFLEDYVNQGWLPSEVLGFFDDATMLHKEREEFIQAGDGVGTVMSEIREYREEAPSTVDVGRRITELGEIQTHMYQIGENTSSV